jgi:hypothetical protein
MDYGYVGAPSGVSWHEVQAAVAHRHAAREMTP